MKRLITCAFVLFFVLLTGCQPKQQEATDMEKETIKKEVKEQFGRLVTALNKMDAKEWSNFYSKDEFISAFVSTELYAKRDAWIDTITKYFSMRQKQQVTVTEVEVTPLAQNLALMTSKEGSEMVIKDGTVMKSNHVFTMVWKKEKEGWKILHSHESWVDIPGNK